eukprot:scpid17635/ scgid15645/ Gag-Pol polyprotein; Matrix protein p10; p20; Capsid protein p25; Nucleocapsid protein p14; Protease p15; Reverse transcriptase/ribonuclease H p90; Integrase p46
MSIKLDSFLRAFKGTPGESFPEFWEKFRVLCTVQGWTSDTDKMKHFPLFLSGDAFLVYDGMEDSSKQKPADVKAKFEEAFCVSKSEAYRLFVQRRLRTDESADAFAADLQRLAKIAGNSGGRDDPMVVEQFIAGLPSDFPKQVRLSFAGEEIKMAALLSKVRALRQSDLPQAPSIAAAAAAPGSSTTKSSVMCHHCQEVGHIRRFCPKRQTRDGSRRSNVICSFCERPGHTRADCRDRTEWEASKKGKAAAVKDGGKQRNHVLCTMNQTTSGSLVRMFLDIRPSDAAPWERIVSVVDTGSTHTLIDLACARRLQLPIVPDKSDSLVALDGQPLKIHGRTSLQLQRLDDAVMLPAIGATVHVVDSLEAIQAEFLIGADVIAASSGLQLRYDDDNVLSGIVFGPGKPPRGVTAAADLPHPSPYVSVSRDGQDTILTLPDGEARWLADKKYWQVKWTWKDGLPPNGPVGHGIGEYSRNKLSADQEQLFQDAIKQWIDDDWLVPHDPKIHGEPAAVLPLLAQVQEHKTSTPVRPCLDYRLLNDRLKSQPGQEAPVCADTLRKWRRDGKPEDFCLLDIKKAYLQVRVVPELQRYQTVVWQGRAYAMTRMGFGLNIAPKIMTAIVQWVTRSFPAVDSYIDDIRSPNACSDAVAAKLLEYGLPTKPAEPLVATRVLGLQLHQDDDGSTYWSRRPGLDVSLPENLTRRTLASWCGKLTGHVPLCGWLRPYCSYLKRMVEPHASWDQPLSDTLVQCCKELASRLSANGDPAHGVWHVPNPVECTLYVDASDVSYGAVLMVDGKKIEDRSWLRQHDDKRHINVAELDAAIKGLNLAINWQFKQVRLVTDSKTVAAWIDTIANNVRRVRTSGLYDVLVQRRLQIIADLMVTTETRVEVDWIPSEQNPADALTRVPATWVKLYRASKNPPSNGVTAAATPRASVIGPVTPESIKASQLKDDVVQAVIHGIQHDLPVDESYARVRSQLVVEDGVLYRSLKLPLDGVKQVPVIPAALVRKVLYVTHTNSGHASWSTMYEMIRSRCYFPKIAAACEAYVANCGQCVAANPSRAPAIAATRPDIPCRPWSEVVIDTLELGSDGTNDYHCVLMCVDAFTKWIEVVPLRRHDAASVASAFVQVCQMWGAPDVVRCDNGTEFANAVVESLFQSLGVRVRTGAVRHPQSQGAAERANRTLIGLIRKVLEYSSDWKSDLRTLLFYYRNRPHSATHLSPMEAMVGWQPARFIVESPIANGTMSASAWVDKLAQRSAAIRDLIEEELSSGDSPDVNVLCLYSPGDAVMLRRPERRQKRSAPYERGWRVRDIVSASTVVIRHQTSGAEKTVNVDLLKRDSNGSEDGACLDANVEQHDNDPETDMAMSVDFDPPTATDDEPARNLRSRADLQRPARYND